MAEIVLFHHVQGLTTGVTAFADELRTAGHTVHTPDQFEGRTFSTLDEGMEYARNVGFGNILDRGVSAVDGLDANLVYAGFSMGVMPAQKLTQTRKGARGALFFHSCLPISEFGAGWPAGVPVQVHGMEDDEFFNEDLPFARDLVDVTDQAELFIYPGDAHLFADSSLPSHDQPAAELMTKRSLDFLSTLG